LSGKQNGVFIFHEARIRETVTILEDSWRRF